MLRPSEVRELILRQHRELRDQLRTVDDLAKRVLGGDAAPMELRRRIVEMEAAFEEHLRTEEGTLLPLIAALEIPGFGAARVDAVKDEHTRQRRILQEVADRAVSAAENGTQLAHKIRVLIRDLLIDMSHEEDDLLRADLLQDP